MKTTQVLTLLAATLMANYSTAAVISNSTIAASFTASSTDLLQTNLSTTANTGIVGADGNDANSILGMYNGVVESGNTAPRMFAGNGDTLTLNFDVIGNPDGYTISQINVYSGWDSSGRGSQNYNVFYSTVAAPGTFIALSGAGGSFSNLTANRHLTAITDPDDGILASGVASIRFNFSNVSYSPSGSGPATYREIDIISVPEPSLAFLSAMGMLGLLRRRRS